MVDVTEVGKEEALRAKEGASLCSLPLGVRLGFVPPSWVFVEIVVTAVEGLEVDSGRAGSAVIAGD